MSPLVEVKRGLYAPGYSWTYHLSRLHTVYHHLLDTIRIHLSVREPCVGCHGQLSAPRAALMHSTAVSHLPKCTHDPCHPFYLTFSFLVYDSLTDHMLYFLLFLSTPIIKGP